MNSDKMEINFENLGKVSGGTTDEARAYIEELAPKYGTRDGHKLNELVTKEEFEHLKWLLTH